MVAQAPGVVADTGTGFPLSKYCSGGVKGFGCSGAVWLINNLAIPAAFPDWQPLTVEWDPDFGNLLKYFAAHKQSGQWGWH